MSRESDEEFTDRIIAESQRPPHLDIRAKIRDIISDHMYENECALWSCNCGVRFGPPAVDGVDWEHHIADVLATALGSVAVGVAPQEEKK